MRQADIIIVGGGLAGLTAAIHLSKQNLSVLLFEKDAFPQHKVCGEYLSKEVLPYYQFLGLDLSVLEPVHIKKLSFSTQKGKTIHAKLDLGGLGISRYALDNFLFEKAKENGVEIVQEQITAVHYYDDFFEVKNSENTSYYAKVVLGAYGKRSNLDKYLDRDFIKQKSGWLAVKAHFKANNFPNDLVALHNFNGGYCGISKIENGNVNVCYLATYESFKDWKDPQKYQEHVLSKNKHLKKFFAEAEPVFEHPLTIAQIYFNKKTTTKDHVLMLGDAAGLIHPLCGNGMAMAIHSGKIASEAVINFFRSKNSNLKELEKNYEEQWNYHFKKRLKYGKWLQNIMIKAPLAEASQSLVTAAPFILPQIIKKTHGTPIL